MPQNRIIRSNGMRTELNHSNNISKQHIFWGKKCYILSKIVVDGDVLVLIAF